ncbi:autophagy- protein 2 [Microbotryomycetes sp. JL221]|nr:autophagy- protein 2 [Microbotryomycetes sp. JL221]
MPWSFVSSLLPSLPSLPAVPSLPQSVQRRLLSFLLRKAIGQFVEHGLDSDTIESDLGNGHVRAQHLRLAKDAIEPLLVGLPVQFISGNIGAMSANVSWPLSLASTISLGINDLDLVLRVDKLAAGDDVSSDVAAHHDEIDRTMSDSVMSFAVASEFVSHELDETQDSQLRQSLLDASLASSTASLNVPGGFDDRPIDQEHVSGDDVDGERVAKVNILAGLIERVLARLSVNVVNINVTILFGSIQDQSLEFVIDNIKYATDESADARFQLSEDRSSKRMVSISPPTMYLNSPPLQLERQQPLADDSPSDSGSSSDDDLSSESEMIMSQSIADLRDSFVSAQSSTNTFYASAQGSTLAGLREKAPVVTSISQEAGSPFFDPESSDDSTTNSSVRAKLLSFGVEDIIVKLASGVSATEERRTGGVSIHVHMSGPVTFMLQPYQLAPLLNLGAVLSRQEVDADATPAAQQHKSTPLELSATVKFFQAIVLYDTASVEPLPHNHIFWSHPATHQLSHSHLNLRVDDVQLGVNREGREPASTQVTFAQVSLTESTTLGGQKGSLPIVISDPLLSLQYGRDEPLPRFEAHDWIRSFPDTKMWRTRPRARVRAYEQQNEMPNNTARSALTLSLQRGQSFVHVAPFHLFADLTLLQRLDGFTELLSAEFQLFKRNAESGDGSSTPRAAGHPHQSTPESMLRDLHIDDHYTNRDTIAVRFDMLRLSIRCPASPSFQRKQNDNLAIRSGIAMVDLHSLYFHTRQARSDNGTNNVSVSFERALLALASPEHKNAPAFLSLSSLSPDEHESSSAPPICPTITIEQTSKVGLSPIDASQATINEVESAAPCQVDINAPLIKIDLDKSIFDRLQLFADDISRWSNQTSTVVTTTSTMEFDPGTGNHKLIGSRYFGTRSFARPRRAGSESSDGTPDGALVTRFNLTVTDAVVDVRMIRQGAQNRDLRARVSDVRMRTDILKGVSANLRLQVDVGDAEADDCSDPNGAKVPILSRCLPRKLGVTAQPLIQAQFTSLSDPETTQKESRIQLYLGNIICHIQADLSWLDDLARFAKAPAGAFEEVVPSELVRLRIKLSDVCFQASAPATEAEVVCVLVDVKVSGDLMPDNPRNVFDLTIDDARICAIDSLEDLIEALGKTSTAAGHFKSRGFVELVQLRQAAVEIRQGNGNVLPDLEVVMQHAKGSLKLCADSIASLSAFATHFGQAVELGKRTDPRVADPPPEGPQDSRRAVDLFASVDETAFGVPQEFHDSPVDLIDDVPSNTAYLSEQTSKRRTDRAAQPDLTSGSRHGRAGQVISEVDGETITMMDPAGLQIVDDYLNISRLESEANNVRLASVVRCRVSQCDFHVQLHDGYDWARTRKAIEDEARAVRRRLAKIRQLLAHGQQPDASAEEASVLMFGSVQLGLPPGASELPPAQLIAAIDEELRSEADTDIDTESTASEWEPILSGPQAPGASSRVSGADSSRKQKTTGARTGKKRKRLTRSRDHAIHIVCQDLTATFDSFPAQNDTASRIRIDLEQFSIVDNVATSTWHKFLTELRPSDGGVVRPSGAPMVRIELKNMRSLEKEEIALKIKISPLRLYIDQDALDFLKAFGAFRYPGALASEAATLAAEPFFQRVEVLPVKIKLDYKPKRVDLRALRQGRTAELMNFFHFDGSEMTLRHLVVTGISGSTRLSELVQEIWTPDVKANQLADVVSGIAPVRSIVNVGSGVANLVLLPIEQYRKDGRIVRGLQKGATTFAKQTTLEALNVGAKLATGTQVILERAESVLGAGRIDRPIQAQAIAPSAEDGELEMSQEDLRELISRYASQPQDLKEGMATAYQSLGSNLRSAAQTILAVPMEVYERSGTEGPVRAVVRAVPIAVLKPMIGATEAVSKTLFGLRNSLDEDAQAEANDKYKRSTREI